MIYLEIILYIPFIQNIIFTVVFHLYDKDKNLPKWKI